MPNYKVPSEEIQGLLKACVDEFDLEDLSVRERQVRVWRQLKLLWEGFSRTYWSEVAHDWRVLSLDDAAPSGVSDQEYYDKPINVFRAYLESIIAALSITVPAIKCFPDDAENPLDLSTARAGDKIAKLVSRHNDVSLLWLHALFIYCTEGMVACYNYSKESIEYGTYKKSKYEEVTNSVIINKCPKCGEVLPSDESLTPDDEAGVENPEPLQDAAIQERANELRNQFDPSDADVQVQGYLENTGTDICPFCLMMIAPESVEEPFVVTRLVGETLEPKSRVCLEAFGGLNVKVPNYAKNQKQMPYLMLFEEINYVDAVETYSHLSSKFNRELIKKIKRNVGIENTSEEWARISSQYQGEYPKNVVTKKSIWLRPCAFNIHEEEDIRKLKKLYPNGCRIVYINDEFAEACNESLDDHWTITHNPLADFIHYNPLGLLLTSVQDITNDLISLVLQTIEHGIPQTFADPTVLNFSAYAQSETTPGGIYQAKAKTGQSLGNSFHEVKTATLSPEVMPFGDAIQSLGQMASGALPSIFGGQIQGSETASEYSMSRAQAQQRIQNTWKMFIIWWKVIFSKVIPMYINEQKEDERNVELDKDGNFINVFIRKADLEGKIGRVELEASDALPLTVAQRKEILTGLLENNNPAIQQFLMASDNLGILKDAIGLDDFYVPGQDDREKQYDEIKILLNSEPIVEESIDPVTGQMIPMEMPSVEIDPIFDNHQIEFDIVRKWAISEAGRMAKVDNPSGYQNVLLHGKMHYDMIQQAMMQQATMQQEDKSDNVPGEKPNQLDQEAPIMGEDNVTTIQ